MNNLNFQMWPILLLWISTAMGAGNSTDPGNLWPEVHFKTLVFSKKVSLLISELDDQATLAIYDQEGHELILESITRGSYAKIFDLSQLDEGDYSFHLSTGLRELEQPFEITSDRLLLDSKNASIVYLPVVRPGENSVDLLVFNQPAQRLKVLILDESGDIVFEERVHQPVTRMQKRYDVSMLERGNYTLQVRTHERIFQQNFKR